MIEWHVRQDLDTLVREELRANDARRRIMASRVLRETASNPTSVSLLLDALHDERDADALGWLIAAVGQMADPSAVPTIHTLGNDGLIWPHATA